MRSLERRPEFPSISPIGLVYDSTTSFPPALAKSFRKEGILVAPVNSWVIEGEIQHSDYSFDPDEFYEMLEEADKLLATSHANPNQFEEAFESLIKEGVSEIISIHSDVRLTGGYGSANIAAKSVMEKHPNVRIHPFDSRLTTAGAGIYALEAVEKIKQGKTFAEIVENLENQRENVKWWAAITNADFLFRSAQRRANVASIRTAAGAAAIKVFKRYPIITLEAKDIHQLKLVKGEGKINKELISLITVELEKGKSLKRVVLLHTGCKEEAIRLANCLEEELGIKIPESNIWDAGTILGVYAGQGCRGVACWFE